MQTISYGNNLRILKGIKFKKILNHDFTAAQPLSKSSGDQVNGTIGVSQTVKYCNTKSYGSQHVCSNTAKIIIYKPNKCIVAVGNAYFNHCNDENPQVSPVAVTGRPRDSVTRRVLTRLYSSFKFSNVTLAGYVCWVQTMCFTKLYCRYRCGYSDISGCRVFVLPSVSFLLFD